MLASSGADRRLMVWDLAKIGEEQVGGWVGSGAGGGWCGWCGGHCCVPSPAL